MGHQRWSWGHRKRRGLELPSLELRWVWRQCQDHGRGPMVAVVVVVMVMVVVVRKVVRKVVRNLFYGGFRMVLWYFLVPYCFCTGVLRRFLRFEVRAR